MKIYILGSNSFVKDMVETADKLIDLGFDARLNNDYRLILSGGMKQVGENSEVKIQNDYLKKNYKGIIWSDAVLLVNNTKRDIENYIGGNGLIELVQAYVNDKKIFLLNGLPEGLSYIDEIKAMQPICLNGDLSNINKY